MSATDLRQIAAFRMSFARRQAAEVTAIPGGAVVLDEEFAASYEHNQLVIEGPTAPPDLVALADAALGHLPHRQIAVLDDALGVSLAPALTEAGYAHHPELVMTHSGAAPAPGAAAEPVTLAELRSALLDQQRRWLPDAADEVIRQLADRRAARLRGAEQVRFLAVRDEEGEVASWADLYLDPARDIAQIEELVTADHRTRRGYADTVLATALRQASGCGLFFLIAEPDDWPRAWYARRGFTPIGHAHRFSRT